MPTWVPVPPVRYGGTELVTDLRARGLHGAGREVTLFTAGDATCPVPRRWLVDRALGTEAAPRGEREHVARAYAELAAARVPSGAATEIVSPGATSTRCHALATRNRARATHPCATSCTSDNAMMGA